MKIVELGKKIGEPLVLCLGFFGSMHKGHVEILNRAKLRTRYVPGSKVALFTFKNNHLSVLKGESKLLYTYEERLQIYESLGVDYVITTSFDEKFRNLTGEQFLSKFNPYDIGAGIFCGFDYSCGKNRLSAMGVRKFYKEPSDPPVYIVEEICDNNEKISTTSLRNYISNGQIEKANSLLSEPFFAIGQVTRGRGVGKKLGFPTANIQLSAEKLLPVGVYGGKTCIKGKVYSVIVNIGEAPTFDVKRHVFEAHIINFEGNLYKKTLKVSLTKFLRPITKFNSGDDLKAQLQRDKESVLND